MHELLKDEALQACSAFCWAATSARFTSAKKRLTPDVAFLVGLSPRFPLKVSGRKPGSIFVRVRTKGMMPPIVSQSKIPIWPPRSTRVTSCVIRPIVSPRRGA